MISPEDVEAMASLAHERYARDGSAPTASVTSWEDLEEWQREANRDSVRFAPVLLTALGLEVSREAVTPGVPVVLDPEEVEAGARLEHLRWARFTVRSGRPDHPDLRPWAELDEATRDKDRSRVRDAVGLLARVGVTVIRQEPG